MVSIHRLTAPTSPDDPAMAGVRAFVDADRAIKFDVYGHDDLRATEAAFSVVLRGSPYSQILAWVALPDGTDPLSCAPGDALGYAVLRITFNEDTELAFVEACMRPEHRGRGVARALWQAASDEADRLGRTVLMSATSGPIPGPDDVQIVAASGSGSVRADAVSPAWLQRLGFVLEQVERPSTLAITSASKALFEHQRDAAARAAGDDYEVVTWQGATPDELIEHLAPLMTAMSTDAPGADLALGEAIWDAARVKEMDSARAAKGRQVLTSAVRHRPTGELVAFTELGWEAENHAGVGQWDTLVRRDHRGHRLGMLVKASNLLALLDANPAAERVHTFNAAENEQMLAINTALGFESSIVEGVWQRRPPAADTPKDGN